jgi:hypothetical protein
MWIIGHEIDEMPDGPLNEWFLKIILFGEKNGDPKVYEKSTAPPYLSFGRGVAAEDDHAAPHL